MTRREQAKALKELYARLPRVKCQRKCADQCGLILFSDQERNRIEAYAGDRLTIRAHPTYGGGLPMCSMLTKDGLCGVHPVRPMLCRLFGAIPELPCPHGCEIDRPVPEGKYREFLGEAMRIGGDDHAQIIRPYVDTLSRMVRTLAK